MSDSSEAKEIVNRLYANAEKRVKQAQKLMQDAPLNVVTFTPYEKILGDPISWDVNFTGNSNYIGVLETYMSEDGQYMFTDSFGRAVIFDTMNDVYEFFAEEYNPATVH